MKKTFKGLFVVAFAFVLLLSLTGCGDKENNNGGGNGTQGGNQQQEQQSGKLFDITDDKIRAYDSSLTEVQGEEKTTMINAIPSNIKKAIGKYAIGYATIQPSRNGLEYLFGINLYVDSYDNYKTLTDYYKSLGGTITDEFNRDDNSQLNIDYSWGKLTDCLYRKGESQNQISVTFTLNK